MSVMVTVIRQKMVLAGLGLSTLAGVFVHGGQSTIKTPSKSSLQEREIRLFEAAALGHTESVKTLLKTGAHKDVQNEAGHTPLHAAVYYAHVDTIEALLEAGANTEVRDNDGRTPLHVAVEEAHIKCVEVLLIAGANIDIGLSVPFAKNYTWAFFAQPMQLLILLITGKCRPCKIIAHFF